MVLGAIGAVFLFWLGLLVAIGSETLHLKMESRTVSTMAAWVAALVSYLIKIWGGIAGVLYYKKYVK